jgi:hypothetical protein
MTLLLEPYVEQLAHWPRAGRHILAQFDEESVIVYQAYRPEIGHYAADHGAFGAGFSFSRMTWIKPNFLWMMFRSGWGTKVDQEVTLAIRMRKAGFDALLREAVPSTYDARSGGTEADWHRAVKRSAVRLQWDPDHDPSGARVERRAIQLGIRGETLLRFTNEWILGIEDVSDMVVAQRGRPPADLVVPRERVYSPPSEALQGLGMIQDGSNPTATERADA